MIVEVVKGTGSASWTGYFHAVYLEHLRTELISMLLVLGALGLALGTALQVMAYADDRARAGQTFPENSWEMLRASLTSGVVGFIEEPGSALPKELFVSGMASFIGPAANSHGEKSSPPHSHARRSQKLPVRVSLALWLAGASVAVPRYGLRLLLPAYEAHRMPTIDEQRDARTLAGWSWLFYGASLTVVGTSLDWFLGLSDGAEAACFLIFALPAVRGRLIRRFPQARLIAVLLLMAVLSCFPAA